MVLVYSLLQGHPASMPCEQLLRSRTEWSVSTPTLFEAKAILTKVYGVKPSEATQNLDQIVRTPLAVIAVDEPSALAAMHLADALGVDLSDAVVLHAARSCGAAWLATDDGNLAQACLSLGLQTENPIDTVLRQQLTAWELTNLAPKGLPRSLRRVHQWLSASYSQAAQDFWTHNGGGSHLP
jgi:predicted nucleic acid-binding protein